ncbi:MAG: ROK family protein [Marinilabiliaceae bacterium]|nr:ROK family protein [Marinilabiliaceae bacterium]
MKYAIGIDLGGTNIKYALVAEDAQIIQEAIMPTQADQGREVVIKNIETCCQNLLDYAREHHLEVPGIGLGTPGIIDNGLVLGGAENLPEWESLPLGGILSRRLNQAVYVDNDANMMGLGEVRAGNAQAISDAIFITVGTGIGGAMVLNGKLYGGHRNRGAEMGHIIVTPNGKTCGCGAKGCLEAHASIPALIEDYTQLLQETDKAIPQPLNGEVIVAAYHTGQAEAVQALNQHFDYLAAGITGFINIFSPQKIIIGGGISEAGPFYLQNITDRVNAQVMKETSVFTQIETAQLGNKAGIMGAAALVFDQLAVENTQPCNN